jgi:hypothetical protein
MTLLSKIKDYFFQKNLKKELGQTMVLRKKFGEVATVGILFDASSPEHREIVSQQAEQFRKKGKKVRLLGFFKDKLSHEGTPYAYFNTKDLDWTETPKKETTVISDFIKQPFDLLCTYTIGENKVLDFITALSQANFKAGSFTENHHEMQLMVDTNHIDNDLRFLIKQIDFYLEKINKKHEVAV